MNIVINFCQTDENKTARLKEPSWEPPSWKEMLANIHQMRAARDAPVDSMGAEKCMDEGATPEVRVATLVVSIGTCTVQLFYQ